MDHLLDTGKLEVRIRLLPILTHGVASHLDAVNQPVEYTFSRVGSPICSCQGVTGGCEVRMVERV